MFKLRMACNDPDGEFYYDTGVYTFPTYDKALISAYSSAIQECRTLNDGGNEHGNYFDVDEHMEYYDEKTGKLSGTVYPVSVTWYDRPVSDRENDLQYKLVTGYEIIEVEDVEPYNTMLKEQYGKDVTVKIKIYFDDDGSVRYCYTSARYGDSDNAFETAKEAYGDACLYLSYVGELW